MLHAARVMVKWMMHYVFGYGYIVFIVLLLASVHGTVFLMW